MSAAGWATFAHRFSDYYRSAELWLPPRLRSREWMLVPFGGRTPLRHRSFSSTEILREFLTHRTPADVFYSTAYWKEPEQLKMVDKTWMGADLIFDLDGDHLPGVSSESFPEMLEIIQIQAWKLWSDFLKKDFGFEEKYLQVTFSGHRGFHLHYRDPNLSQLGSDARRELVNHIRGTTSDAGILISANNEDGARGWGPRIISGCTNVVERLDIVREGGRNSLKGKIVDEMLDGMNRRHRTSLGKQKYGKSTIVKLAELLDDSEEGRERRNKVLQGQFDCLGGPAGRKRPTRYRDAFWELVKTDQNIVLGEAGETDDQVTVDVRRVIRYPTSLHGKTGLIVTEFPLARLNPDCDDPFDALSEAVAFSTSKEMVVNVTVENAHIRIGESDIHIQRGQCLNVSEAMATLLVLKGWAELH